MNRGFPRTVAGRKARFEGRSCLVLALLAVTASSTANARGAGPAEQRQAAEARKACLTGDYQKGIAILSDLFVKTEAPEYIYNQGRCLEQNARYAEAIMRFEEYLRVAKGSATKERAEAEEHIADCQSKVARSAGVAPPPASTPPIIVQPSVSTEPKPAATVDQPPSPSVVPGRGLRIAGITVGALGVASLATAVVLNVKANSMADDLNKPAGYDRGKVSDQSNYKTGSWVGYGVGAACLVGGAILYHLGSNSQGASTVALLPVVAPNQAGISLHGGF